MEQLRTFLLRERMQCHRLVTKPEGPLELSIRIPPMSMACLTASLNMHFRLYGREKAARTSTCVGLFRRNYNSSSRMKRRQPRCLGHFSCGRTGEVSQRRIFVSENASSAASMSWYCKDFRMSCVNSTQISQ